jgi:hypothetical protein
MNLNIYNKLKEIWPCSNKTLFDTFGVDVEQDGLEIDSLTYEIDETIMHKFFAEIWQPRLKKFKYSGLKLIDEINSLKPRAVLDVGCGYNEFKGKINNLVGIDPYNKNADVQVKIEDYQTQEKYDVIISLGSTHFGPQQKIETQMSKMYNLLEPQGKIFFRVNPGINNEYEMTKWINFFPWNVFFITEMAKKHNFSVLDLRHDAFDRIYFVYGKL